MPAALAVITTGPASAPVDDVRRLTNHATGEIGSLLAEALVAAGFACRLFVGHGATRVHPPPGVETAEFVTNHDLASALQDLARTAGGDVRCVFHAAALSDYAVAAVRGPHGPLPPGGKLPGNLDRVTLMLEPAAKVLPRLRGWFPRALITAWKYELEGDRTLAVEAARRQLASGRTDLTVVNGAAYGRGFGLLEGAKPPVHFAGKRELAVFLASRAAASRDCHE
jgi:phosphopantothenoylcysteine synthetase/decarboxylase